MSTTRAACRASLPTPSRSALVWPSSAGVIACEDEGSLHPPPDIHTVLCRPSNFAAAERGGSKLHAAFCQDEERRQLHATGESPVFVAVDTGNRKMWYGQLILCFVAQYMTPVELCYVRWLDSPARPRCAACARAHSIGEGWPLRDVPLVDATWQSEIRPPTRQRTALRSGARGRGALPSGNHPEHSRRPVG